MEQPPLHPLERKVLSSLKKGEWVDFDRLTPSSGLSPDQVRRALSWLSSKNLISVRETSKTTLKAVGYPAELALLQRLEASRGELTLRELRESFQSDKEFSAAVGRASSAGWITVSPGPSGQTVKLGNPDQAREVRGLMQRITEAEVEEKEIAPGSRQTMADLIRRGLVSRKEKKLVHVTMTDAGREALASPEAAGLDRITPEVLASRRWKTEPLRAMDVAAPAPVFHPGRRHPVAEFIDEVREVYLSMGFSEISGESVQPAFWNFDALFTPQDHPARELQDTFYVKGARDGSLARSGIVGRVASTHEDGWKTGSRGWRYSWDVESSRRLVLRTHNTVLTVKATAASSGRETRVFSVGRVYRNESLDYKHLAELHQMEGIVIGENLNMRHLMGVLTKFYSKLGMRGVKLWPSYFPYTEPSLQVMTYFEKVGKWLEMGGSGIFRPEVTVPLGVKKPVLAWGCGLERLLMLRLGIDDIRALYDNDLGWLRRAR